MYKRDSRSTVLRRSEVEARPIAAKGHSFEFRYSTLSERRRTDHLVELLVHREGIGIQPMTSILSRGLRVSSLSTE